MALKASEVAAARAIARLARFSERALGDLSLTHYRVLSAIASGDERASRVAANFSLGKPAVSATVDALWRSGLVSKSAAGDDQRASDLALTAEGRRVLERAERSLITELRELSANDEEAAHVVQVLAELGLALEAQSQVRNGRTRGVRPAASLRASGRSD
jgi:DNA-binding MarR family transcriptional regulator